MTGHRGVHWPELGDHDTLLFINLCADCYDILRSRIKALEAHSERCPKHAELTVWCRECIDAFIRDNPSKTRIRELEAERNKDTTSIELALNKISELREIVRVMREALMESEPWIGKDSPLSCGACGTPNAQCDTDCMEFHHVGKVAYNTHKAIALSEKAEGQKP